MNDGITADNLFAPDGYITLSEAIKRTVDSISYDFSGPLPQYRADKAWARLQKELHSGKISSAILKSDGSLEILPPPFWGSDEASGLGISNDRVAGRLRFDFDGRAFVFESDFYKIIENQVLPLPATETPSGLVFISQSDAEGNTVPLTYMHVADVLDAYAEQRRARIDETSVEGWRAAQETLRSDLQFGRINSYHRNHRGLVRPLRGTDWRVDGPILARIIKAKSNRFLPNGGGYVPDDWTSYMDVQTEDGMQSGEILIPSQEIHAALMAGNAGSATFEGSSAPQVAEMDVDAGGDGSIAFAGRPRDHDRELFATVAFKILWEEGKTTQAELVRKSIPAFEVARKKLGAKGEPPGETWVKERVRILWRRLDLNGSPT